MMRKKIKCVQMLLLTALLFGGCSQSLDGEVLPIDDKASNGELDTSQTEGFVSEEDLSKTSYIYVYVCGAVINPGVVMLPQDSRADDALQAAGGFAENAGRNAVNLAARVTDGEKLYIPTLTEEQEEARAQEQMALGLVNINTADAETLSTLPGIGASRAQDIISYREKNGAFSKIEEICQVSGIKESAFAKIQDKITVE